jgi:nucleoside-diphosphate-sugar epimerase
MADKVDPSPSGGQTARSSGPGTAAAPLVDRRILVAGATGTVGLPITLALAVDNEVWALARFTDPSARQALEAASVHCISSDLLAGDLDAIPDDAEILINFARPADPLGPPSASDFDVAITGHAEAVGLLIARCANARSVLHCSSTSMYRRGDSPALETDPLADDRHPRRPTYTLAKICAEAVVRTAARQRDLPTTIARLNVPYGDNGGWPATHLDAIVADDPIVVHPNQPNTFNPIHTDDMIRTIPGLLASGSVPATIVNWAGSDQVSIEDWTAHLGDLVNREPTIVVSPTATEPVTVDTTKLTTLTGQMTIPWHDGMRRMAIARHPDLVS